jgi:hypothetical protein
MKTRFKHEWEMLREFDRETLIDLIQSHQDELEQMDDNMRILTRETELLLQTIKKLDLIIHNLNMH